MSSEVLNVISAELELRRRRKQNAGLQAPVYWQDWCFTLFPNYYSVPFAPHHEDMWEWAELIELGKKPSISALIALLARGGGKSANVEGITIRLGAKNTRRYAWYCSSIQDKADNHVESIGARLESPEFGKYYSKMSQRAVGKYGSSKGWRRERLHTKSGFVVDALGLDTGARGMRIEDQRPDLIILDDIDEKEDSPTTTLKKIRTITETILPAGSSDCAIIFAQNLISPDSIASRLADGRADFLRNRLIVGPLPAIFNLAYEENAEHKFQITSGDPTWKGQSIAIANEQMNDWGLTAFLREAQHDVDRTGGVWDHITFQHVKYEELPKFIETSVWVDPAVTSNDSSDCQGVSAGGKGVDGKFYGIYWWEGIDTPGNVLDRAITKALEIHSLTVGVETDQGGDTWIDVYINALQRIQKKFREDAELVKSIGYEKYDDIIWPRFISDKAGAGYGSKMERNAKMLTDYENGKCLHMIGTHNVIEKALYRFPGEPLDVADSHFWLWNWLMGGGTTRMYTAVA